MSMSTEMGRKTPLRTIAEALRPYARHARRRDGVTAFTICLLADPQAFTKEVERVNRVLRKLGISMKDYDGPPELS